MAGWTALSVCARHKRSGWAEEQPVRASPTNQPTLLVLDWVSPAPFTNTVTGPQPGLAGAMTCLSHCRAPSPMCVFRGGGWQGWGWVVGAVLHAALHTSTSVRLQRGQGCVQRKPLPECLPAWTRKLAHVLPAGMDLPTRVPPPQRCPSPPPLSAVLSPAPCCPCRPATCQSVCTMAM